MTATAPQTRTDDLTLAEAREMIDRGLQKAAELKLAGAIAVVDANGNVVSVTVMEGAPPSAAGVARAKAFLAATMQQPTETFAERMDQHPVRFHAYSSILRDRPFPGAGGVPILRNGKYVGAIATGPGIPPLTEIPGVHPSKLRAGRFQANAEDLVICHALQIPYRSQHG
jgi:uncharacterized protein GlcG (DUF336 family)